jgi:hypothetical protein
LPVEVDSATEKGYLDVVVVVSDRPVTGRRGDGRGQARAPRAARRASLRCGSS